MAYFDSYTLPRLANDFKKGVRLPLLRDAYGFGDRALLKSLLEARKQQLLGYGHLDRVLIERKEFRFPSQPERRLKAILRCVNSEFKQALLLLADSYPRTYFELYHKLRSETNIELPQPQTIACNCRDSLLPAGLITEEEYGKGFSQRVRTFRLNKAGPKYGQPIAAFSIKYAVDHDVSLYDLLGTTASGGDSIAPYNRIRILELISDGGNRIVDLMKQLNLTIEDVRQHLGKLSRLKMLSYSSISSEHKGVKVYRWVHSRLPHEAMTVAQQKRVTREVAHWLYGNKVGERNRIAQEIGCRSVNTISTVLAGLVKQGLARTRFPPKKQSHIELSERSRLILDYAAALRNALSDGHALEEMRDLLAEFMRKRNVLAEYLDAGIGLYRRVSTSINAKPFVEREHQLLQFVRTFQEHRGVGARPVDAAKSLGWTHGTVVRGLRSLLDKGVVVKDRKGPATRYVAHPTAPLR